MERDLLELKNPTTKQEHADCEINDVRNAVPPKMTAFRPWQAAAVQRADCRRVLAATIQS